MKIIHLKSENIKRIKAVSVSPEGNVVVVSGQNDAGKSSVLDSIAYALGGKDLICDVPIRTGASKAKIVVDLGEFKVTRSFSALGGSTLTIEDASGNPQRSPQTVLDRLTSKIAFDPLAFVRMKPAEQLETLRKLVGLDFAALDAARKKAYDERTLVNRELASAKARAAEVEVDPETPDDEVVVSDLMAEMAAIQDRNKVNAEKRKVVETRSDRVTSLDKELAGMREQRAKMESALKEHIALMDQAYTELEARRTLYESAKKEMDALVDEDEAPVRQKINDAGTLNAKVRDKKRYQTLKAEMEKTAKKVEALTEEIEGFDKQKSDQLSAAKFPLEGLSFDDTGVLLNGVPFTQGSQARQLQAAIAIGIAMNPTVRVILVRDASLLDDRSMELVAKMAADHDMQFWLERVSDDAPGAIVIEDGMVKEAAE